MTFFYLSFCDPEKPKGEQFLGAAVVEAPAAGLATMIAWQLGINPGGEVAIIELPELPEAGQKYLNRFVPREEVMAEPYRRVFES